MHKTEHIKKKGFALAITLIFLGLVTAFLLIFMFTSRIERFEGNKKVAQLKAHYMAETAIKVSILKIAELSQLFYQASNALKLGNSQLMDSYLSDINGNNFGIDPPYDFRIISLDLIARNKGSLIVKIVAEGKFRNYCERITKTVELGI